MSESRSIVSRKASPHVCLHEYDSLMQRWGKVIGALCLIIVLIIPASAAGGDSCDADSSVYEEELLRRINRYRRENHLKALSRHETVHALARGHSRRMCKEGALTHERFEERYVGSGRSVCVENVGWNYTTAENQFRGWKGSKGHDRNMLDKKIRIAGIAKCGAYVTFFACD